MAHRIHASYLMARRISTAKLSINKPRRKAKQTSEPETVTHCDQCGEKLNRTCIRTAGSAVCAGGCGIVVKHYGLLGGPAWMFFCCPECAETYRVTHKNEWKPL